MVDDSAAIVKSNDNSLGFVIKNPKVTHVSHMEQAILKQKIASTQPPNIFLQMFLCADYLLSHPRLNDLRLNCISRPFIIELIFFYYIDFLIVAILILRYTYSLQHSRRLRYKKSVHKIVSQKLQGSGIIQGVFCW